ncbi:MAG TPA: PadR family transcriptional regulator [Bryobacteraceae bacterium]|jgi:transcriptional regulator|nr:PadR family transcriptional regulator [Bryobacteraceae bacterium]
MAPLELLILKSLESGPNHGFGITLHVQEASGGLLGVEEGSLYPALHRLAKEGALAAEWSTTAAGRRARFYSLTPAGRKRLAKAEQQWAVVAKGMARLLRFA